MKNGTQFPHVNAYFKQYEQLVLKWSFFSMNLDVLNSFGNEYILAIFFNMRIKYKVI